MCSSIPGTGRRGRRLRVRAALAPPGHQSRALQRLLDPGIAQMDAVLLGQLLVEVAHVQVEVPLPIEPQHRNFHLNTLEPACRSGARRRSGRPS